MKICQKGQSTLEVAIMSLMLMIFLTAFCGTLYIMYVSYWAEHILYESLICQEERRSRHVCITKAEKQIRDILLFPSIFEIKMDTQGSIHRANMQMKIDIPFVDKKILLFRKELRI